MFGDEPTIAAGRTLSGEDTVGAPVDVPVDAHPTMAGRYRVLEILGRGGMGIVYLAHDPRLGRDIALKVCLDADESTKGRVRREAKSLAALTHPNVVDVYDIGEHEGLLYIAMEYVSGGNAKDRFGRGHLRPCKEVLEFYRGAAMGLAAAHRADIIHRDFKPENVLITRDGVAKVADFGLATGQGASGSVETPVGVLASEERITRAGAIVGTPAFMAPEQLLGLDVDARADQYAFCATLFEGLFGRRPYPSGTVQDRISGLAAARVAWPRDTRGVPKRVLAALERGLSMDPDARFTSMEALLLALGPTRRRLWPLVGAAAGIVALASVATWAEDAPPGCTLADALPWSAEDSGAIEDRLVRLDATALARVTRDLERFAESWNAERDAHCARGGPPAQRTCLTRTRHAFEARVELLRSGDADVVSRAQTLVANLPPPDTCRNADPDAGAELSAQQQQIITLLERASAHGDAGRVLEADGLTAEALTLARSLDQPSLLTRALIERGEVVHQRGNVTLSLELLEEAYFVAKANGDGATATDAARMLAPRHAAAHHDEHAQRWLDIAQTEVSRVGGESLHLVRGRTLMHLERFDEAKLALEHALEDIADQRRPGTRYEIVATQAAIATLEGVPADERAHFTEERLALALELFGPIHPDTAIAYEDLATVLRGQGKHEEAIAALERARAIAVDALGPSNLALVELDNKLSNSHLDAGDLDAAEAALRRALRLQQRSGAGDPAGLVNVESNLGSLLERTGRTEEAIDLQERALTHAEEAFGTGAVKTAMVRLNLASVLLHVQNTSRALDLLGDALEVFEDRLDPRHPALFVTALATVHAYIDADRLDDAQRALAKARTFATDARDQQARIASSQALLHLERGAEAPALEGSQRCVELLADAATSPVRIQCLERAARILLSGGRRAETVALLEPELDTIRNPNVPQSLAASLLYALAASTPQSTRAMALAEESFERVGSRQGRQAAELREKLAERFGLTTPGGSR